jgi:hypothetical protein
MVQLSATRCSYIAILWVNLVSCAAITFCVASQRMFIVVSVYFVIKSVQKLLDTPSYTHTRARARAYSYICVCVCVCVYIYIYICFSSLSITDKSLLCVKFIW